MGGSLGKLAKVMKDQSNEGALAKAFAAYDADHNGIVSQEELVKVVDELLIIFAKLAPETSLEPLANGGTSEMWKMKHWPEIRKKTFASTQFLRPITSTLMTILDKDRSDGVDLSEWKALDWVNVVHELEAFWTRLAETSLHLEGTWTVSGTSTATTGDSYTWHTKQHITIHPSKMQGRLEVTSETPATLTGSQILLADECCLGAHTRFVTQMPRKSGLVEIEYLALSIESLDDGSVRVLGNFNRTTPTLDPKWSGKFDWTLVPFHAESKKFSTRSSSEEES